MAMRTLEIPLWLALAANFGGCTEPPKPGKKPHAEPTERSAAVSPAPAASDAAKPGAVSDPVPVDPVGSRFEAPAWYSTDIIAHTKIIQDGRSEAREDGTFSSALVLQLEPGMDADACLQQLTAKAEGDGLSFGEPETGADGRLTVRAENDRYRVTFVCGEAKGVPTAYVGFEWKSGA